MQGVDLKPLYAQVKSVAGSAGAPAIDPAILMALWLWATIDGVGSARELDRLCERDHTYQWLCGGVGVNHHSLAHFRTAHAVWLDQQLTRSITALMARRLVTLDVVAQDGLRVRASAKASSFRRKDRLHALQASAREQVEALKAELDADARASTRRKQAARERAVRERAHRLEQALDTLDHIDRHALDKVAAKAAARAARNKSGKPRAARTTPDQAGGKGNDEGNDKGNDNDNDNDNDNKGNDKDDDKGSNGTEGSNGTQGGKGTERRAPVTPTTASHKQTRVSTTDPEARIMKMADGGYRPAFNVQLAVDEATQFIAGIEVVDQGSDMQEMQPMHEQLQQRYDHRPRYWLADGGYPKYEALEALMAQGIQPVAPPPARSRNVRYDPMTPKPTDTSALARWRALMASAQGQALYRRRAASVECANAQLRRRGLDRFNVCGKAKARAVVLWHALAHNLMRMRSLNIAFTA